MPVIVIAASRRVNKNVSTGAVIRAKPGTELSLHKLWQTIKLVLVTSLGAQMARMQSDSSG